MNLLVWRLSQWWRTSLDLSLHEFFFNYLISLNSSDTPINTKTTYANLINANLLKQTDFLINNSAFEIQVLSTLAIKCRGGSASENIYIYIDTFVYYVGNGFGMPQHFAKGYDLIFKQLRLLVIPNYLVYL